jgi:hypothetical protein
MLLLSLAQQLKPFQVDVGFNISTIQRRKHESTMIEHPETRGKPKKKRKRTLKYTFMGIVAKKEAEPKN